jgi:hypothetical protein
MNGRWIPEKRPIFKETDMNKQCRKSMFDSIACGLLALAFIAPFVSGQSNQDDVLKKKYAGIIGKYELDLSSQGGGSRTIEFYVRNGAFWIEYGFTSPGELKPEKDSVEVFTFDEPDDGPVKITFMKNDQGQYEKCRFVVDSLGLDIYCLKIKQ